MGWTSENVAQDFNISREDMDTFAATYVRHALLSIPLLFAS